MQKDNWKVDLLQQWFELKSNAESAPLPKHIQDEIFATTFYFTKAEWKETVRHYNYKCAYCQSNPYQVVDHFYPYARGGQTALDNLVPACKYCNSIKRELLPHQITFVSQSVIVEIKTFLSTRTTKPSRKSGYLALFPYEMTRMEKSEFYRNVNEINLRLQTIQQTQHQQDASITIVSLGVEYSVDHIIIGVSIDQQNEYAHCTFVCKNQENQVREIEASKEYVEDYLELLRMFCIQKSIFIDWNALEEQNNNE